MALARLGQPQQEEVAEKSTLSSFGPHGPPDGVQPNAQGRPKPWLRSINQARAKNHGISNGVRWSM